VEAKVMENACLKKSFICGIILLMFGANVVTSIGIDKPVEKQLRSEYCVGIAEHPNGNGCTGLIKNIYDDIVISIKNFDETNTLLDLPKYANTWTELHNGITVDYNHPEGIYFTGVSPEYYRSINTTLISENDYTIIMKIHFTDRWHNLGCIFNFIDENNYCFATLSYDRDEYKYIVFTIIEDGVSTEESIYYPLTGNTDYDFKVKVNNTNDLVFLYVNGVLEWTVYLPPTIVYIDDDFNSSTPGWGYDHFSSIQAGVDAVDVGGTVFVKDGTYTEQFLVPEYSYVFIDKSINLIGENKLTTIINCPDPGVFDYSGIRIGFSGNPGWVEVSNAFISGFSVSGSHHPQSIGIYVQMNARNITIDDCIAHSFSEGISVRADCFDIKIKNCTSYDNSREGGICFRDGGSNFEVTGCNLYSNSYGIFILNVYAGTDYLIYHNNFHDNTVNAYDTRNSQYWHNSLLQEGNYYDDYTGVDNNGDGIGDTPYDISGGSNKDLYPFMEQDGWLQTQNQLPVADAGGPYYANVNNAITFSGSGSSDTDGTIVGYRWDFTNDGTYDTDWLASATTTHSYPAVGTYTVNLQVKDNDGGTDTDTATATITSEGGAIPTAEANGPYSGYVDYSVQFSSSGSNGGSGGTITSYYWTFGDGFVSSQPNPTHTYTSPGMYTVTLKVANNYGQIDNDTTTATITELSPNQTPPVANAGGPYSGVVGTPITFDGSGSNDSDGTIVSYLWNFGDSTSGTGISPTHTYTTAGNYTIILTVTDNETLTHSNSTTARINVSGPPTIAISVDVSNIEPIEEENEKTIPVTVYCYHQSVSNIHLEILESSNLTVTLVSPNITLNPGETQELLIKIKAPKLVIPKNSQKKVGDETIVLRAVGDSNVTSNTEQINIKVVQKGATPGFELVFVLCAIVVAIFLWRKKRSI
jgi:PKD repeat protein